MPRQNTFTIVPRAGQHAAESPPARPMTSKQVRKAYKASTKTPSMTHAERRKWEKAEQERIRKEFEKEKTAAKARAAREKKKEKEAAEMEQKKRSGLPLVVVRPSQDTIARFVRGNGTGKKRDGGVDGESEDEPVTKKAVMEMPQISEAEEGENECESPEVDEGMDNASLEDDEFDIDILDELDKLEDLVQRRSADADDVDEKQEYHEEESDATLDLNEAKPQTISNPPANEFIKPPLPPPAARRSSSPPHAPQAPPMSTQAIFTNIDDFFPNSSQQQRELEDDGETDFGSFPLSDEKRHESASGPANIPTTTTDRNENITTSQDSLDLGSSIQLDDISIPQAEAKPAPLPETPLQAEATLNINTEPSTKLAPASNTNPETSTTPAPAAAPSRFFTPSGSREQLSLALQRSRRTAALEELREKERQRQEAGATMRRSKQQAEAQTIKATSGGANTNAAQVAAKTSLPMSNNNNKENTSPGVDDDVYNDLFGSQETEYGGDWIDEAALDLAI